MVPPRTQQSRRVVAGLSERNPRAGGLCGSCFRVIGLGTLCLLGCLTSLSEEPHLPNDRVRAAFLYNFAVLCQWPQPRLPTTDAALVMGVVKDEAFARLLKEIIDDRQVRGHPIEVRRVHQPTELAGLHLLYLPRSANDQEDRFLKALAGHSILSVGEGATFVEHGGIIQFIDEQEKVRFRINLDASRRHRLKLSSRLLVISRLYREPTNPAAD